MVSRRRKTLKKSRRARRTQRRNRRTRRGGSFKWKHPWHSLKKGLLKRVSKKRYDLAHQNKVMLRQEPSGLHDALLKQAKIQGAVPKTADIAPVGLNGVNQPLQRQGRSAAYPFGKQAAIKPKY